MTRLTRKLMISILTVVLSISALGTTTFAWFTLTNVATIEAFDANIISDTGIEISLDGVNWYSTLTADMIYDVIPENFEFNHVTTSDAKTFLTLDGSTLEPTTSGYLSIPIYFRSEDVQTITWTSVSLTGQQVAWESDVAFTASDGSAVLAGGSINVDASNAIRIAMIDPLESLLSPVVYEKPADTGIYYNTVLNDASADLYNDGDGANGAMNYYFKKTNGLPPQIQTFTTIGSIDGLDGGVDVLQMQETDEETQTFEFGAGILGVGAVEVDFNAAYGGVMFLNIWFEGFDAEAYDSLLGLVITLSLAFGEAE